ncbi:hypothetical protein T03_4959 [Trichinella britovi]|uniref:Uncharacterized protein n=1 Tax=Trichinella britovi TaxID=45882 RepID=A0A0V1CN84_TRIBR|nr:hypothetical protein T03_4959 [Trichinella britovi]KRZ92255.1 hypothetical protein T08_10610 [Trichinella sp. T8]
MHSFKFIGIRVEACLGERISINEKSKTLVLILAGMLKLFAQNALERKVFGPVFDRKVEKNK